MGQLCETCKKKDDYRCYCSPNSCCSEYEVTECDEAGTSDSWSEISDVLIRYEIPYTARYESRQVGEKTIYDKHIQINLVIPDYFKEEGL